MKIKKKSFESISSNLNSNYSSNITFTTEQQEVINIFNHQLDYIEKNTTIIPKRTIVIQGKAGSGKSTLIQYFVKVLNRKFGPNSYALVAPTGAAAKNINGSTIHSKLFITIDKHMKPLDCEPSKRIQENFRNCKFLIIDEMSLIGCALLKKIDRRCRTAKPDSQNISFGGMYVYLFGDIKQLPPVSDRPLYSERFGKLSIYNEGQMLFRNMDKYIFLNTSLRQFGNDQQIFRDILDRISNGKVLIEDWKRLMLRTKQNLNKNELSSFKDAIRLFTTNNKVNDYNLEKLKLLNQPIAKIEGEHNCEAAKKADPQVAGGLSATLLLSIGSRIMLRNNFWTEQGLVNGALGYVRKIVYRSEYGPPYNSPELLMIEFDKYVGPTIDNLVPIPQITRYWKTYLFSCNRKQFPVELSWAITIHKSQGFTLDKAVIDIDNSERNLGLTYVALSKVKTLEGIMFLQSYNFKRFDNLKKSLLLQDRLNEEQRMKKKL